MTQESTDDPLIIVYIYEREAIRISSFVFHFFRCLFLENGKYPVSVRLQPHIANPYKIFSSNTTKNFYKYTPYMCASICMIVIFLLY